MLTLRTLPIRFREKSTAETATRTNDCLRTLSEVNLIRSQLILDPWKAAIARLTKEEIRILERFDLIHIVQASRVFSSRRWVQQIGFLDRDGLEFLTTLVRQSFRYEVNTIYRRCQKQVFFRATSNSTDKNVSNVL